MSGREILLVEDNPGDVLLFRKAMERCGLDGRVRVATDGAEALRQLREVLPDLVLLDLNLPGVDGREVLRQLKADRVLRRVPVVVMTSSDADEDVVWAYETHANSFIRKPGSLADLERTLVALDAYWFGLVRLPGAS